VSITRGRRVRGGPLLVDIALAAGLSGLSLLAIMGGAGDTGRADPVNVGLLLLQTIPLVARRVAPLPVFAITFGATALHIVSNIGSESLSESLGSLVALYTVAERSERRISVPTVVFTLVTFIVLFTVAGALPQGLAGLVQTLLGVLLAWAFGDVARTRRVVAELLTERARRSESDREERARRAVQAERERIARELHDIVTHHVSVVVIQAAAAQRALEPRPAQARQALEAIEQTGRQALADMRRMLGILGAGGAPRGEDGSGVGAAQVGGSIAPGSHGAATSDPAGLEPLPRLDQLGVLLERVRAAGLPVEIAVAGRARRLDDGIELSAYRIVQEALTNSLKHARGGVARIDLRYEADALEIEVVDGGGTAVAGIEPTHGGRGLIGMRERVAMFGGRFDAGPTADGFRVAARLPLGTAPAAQPPPAL
jgi:signal transduction histidine kinase